MMSIQVRGSGTNSNQVKTIDLKFIVYKEIFYQLFWDRLTAGAKSEWNLESDISYLLLETWYIGLYFIINRNLITWYVRVLIYIC